LVTVAALAPSISVQEMIDWAGRLVKGHPNRVQIVAGPARQQAKDSSPATVLDERRIRAPGLPRSHLIGSGPELSEQVVMVIYPKEYDHSDSSLTPSPTERGPDDSAQPYYWRSLTYDVYTGRGWVTGGTQMLEYRAGEMAAYAEAYEPLGLNSQTASVIPLGRRKVSAEVRAVTGLGELVYAAGELVTVDHDYRVAWRSADDAFGAILSPVDHALSPEKADLPTPAGEPERVTRTGNSGIENARGAVIDYRFASLVPAVGEAQLRTAGTDYPIWIQGRYLTLPTDVPSRVLALARDLTATEPTAYDRALAIESYLRTFTYNLDIPPPKFDGDLVDSFLFDLKQGYCDYYATSMVVLARAAGLPARLVVGYHTGTYDEVNHRYVVTEADAHAWVEIFFPGYGWVEFEPTAGVPPIRRPADVPPVMPTELEALSPAGVERVVVTRLWWLGLPAVVVFLGLGVIILFLVDSWRLRFLSPEATIAALYGRLYRHGQRLAVRTRAGETPFEYAASLAERMEELAEKGVWATVFAPLAREAHWLISLYVRICYGPHSADKVYQQQAIRAWRRLYWRLLLARTYRSLSSAVRLSPASSRSVRRPAS
jgi:transglutaminase-like putative cysteine protease